MIKKILFWLYVVGGPAAVIFLTFEESLWPRMIPFDYLFSILIGILTYILSVIIMTNKNLNIKKNKVLFIFMPFLIYIGLLPLSLIFHHIDYNVGILLWFILWIMIVYAILIHITVLIYNHWVSPKINQEPSDQPSRKLTFPKMTKFLKRSLKIMTISFLMFILPIIGFALVLVFNSELNIRNEIYIYNDEPSAENLADLTIDLINYRSYEERIIYLPLALKDDEVLNLIYELREDSGRAYLYGMMGEANISSIYYSPEDVELLIMSQYINAYLLLGRNQEYLNLMLERANQDEFMYFYYLFLANNQIFSLEYKAVLPDMLIAMNLIYDAHDQDDRASLFNKMLNVRTRQTIYFIQGDQENDDRLEVIFNQLADEMKTFNESSDDE